MSGAERQITNDKISVRTVNKHTQTHGPLQIINCRLRNAVDSGLCCEAMHGPRYTLGLAPRFVWRVYNRAGAFKDNPRDWFHSAAAPVPKPPLWSAFLQTGGTAAALNPSRQIKRDQLSKPGGRDRARRSGKRSPTDRRNTPGVILNAAPWKIATFFVCSRIILVNSPVTELLLPPT